jgi:uroporphyrinogen III methyltransferase/synthase
MKQGKVYLVGAGPGDPGLMTLRGSECLRQADVVVYDHLVNREIVAKAPKTAQLVYAGKTGGRHVLAQPAINRLLVAAAARGKTVVRLKGGDPILFGRGAEEALELARRGIPFEIVPGVSSAVAVPAAAGIPLTCRSLASTVTVVTGHEAPGRAAPAVAWEKLLDECSTVVVLMGVENLAAIARRLGHPEMPAAVVREGTLPTQRIVTGTLATIAERAGQAGIRPPAVLVAGRVVGLRDVLWQHMQKPFLPLAGRHILVTRPAPAGDELAALLRELGAAVTLFPLIRIAPARAERVDPVIRAAPSFNWIVLSSANGADLFAAALKRAGIARAMLRHTRLAAIGPKTAARLAACDLQPDLVPATYRQESLAEEIGRLTAGKRASVLLLHAQESRTVLEDALRAQGCAVTALDLYRTRMTGSAARLAALLRERPADAVTVTSSVGAQSLARLLDDRALRRLRERLAVAAIGPVCAAAARALGMYVPVVAEEYTAEGLAAALAGYYGGTRRFTEVP